MNALLQRVEVHVKDFSANASPSGVGTIVACGCACGVRVRKRFLLSHDMLSM